MPMSPMGEANRSISLDSSANDFIKIAKVLAASGGRLDVARQLASQVPSSRVRDAIENGARVTKAGVAVGGLTDALAWYRNLQEGFVGSLSEFAAFPKLWNLGELYAVPARTILGILTSAPVGDNSAEGFAKAITSANFTTGKLEPTKSTSTIILTNELARSITDAATAMFGREIRRAAAIALDTKFLSILAATPGATSAASSGTTAAQILSDLSGRLAALTIGADSRLWFICSAKLYKQISLLQGTGGYLLQNNKIGGISIAPSDAATSTAYLIDAKQVAANLDSVVINASSEASLQFDDNPTSSAFQTISLYASNLTALQAEIWWAALAVRGSAVSLLTGYS